MKSYTWRNNRKTLFWSNCGKVTNPRRKHQIWQRQVLPIHILFNFHFNNNNTLCEWMYVVHPTTELFFELHVLIMLIVLIVKGLWFMLVLELLMKRWMWKIVAADGLNTIRVLEFTMVSNRESASTPLVVCFLQVLLFIDLFLFIHLFIYLSIYLFYLSFIYSIFLLFYFSIYSSILLILFIYLHVM